MNRLLPGIFFLFVALAGHAQCPDLSFQFASDPYRICLKQEIELNNTSTSGGAFAWDFCPENFTETPSITSQSVSKLSQGRGFKLVHDGLNWYGFLTSRNSNSLLRLDFGADLQSSFSVSDLGTLSGALMTPEGIDVALGDDGSWYGFTGSGSSGKLLRLEFGSSLTNVPAVTNFESAAPGERFRDMAIVRQDSDYIVVAVSFNTNKLLRINFGNSLANTITSTDITSHVITGASGLIGLDIARVCDDWYIHTVSFSDNAIQQLYFGTDLLTAPVIQHAATYDGISNPFKIEMHSIANRFYALVANQNAPLCVIDFDDLSLTKTPSKIENLDLPSLMGIDVLWHQGKTVLMGGSGSTFSYVQFENVCPANVSYSLDEVPVDFKYMAAGTYPVELRVLKENRLSYAGAVTVVNKSLPELDVEVNGMCVSSPVKFNLQSDKDIAAVLWDFGDGNISAVENPSNLFSASGAYNSRVSVTDLDGCIARAAAAVPVYDAPVSSFNLPTTLLCTNNEHLFSTTTPDTYDGNLSYQWFVDDNPISSDRHLLHTFTSTGPKEVRLVTSIPGCSDEMTITTEPVEVGPVVDFSYTGTCENDIFSFQQEISDAIETYEWDFGDDTSDDQNPSWEFASFGDYTVSLTATNAIGCKNIKRKIVTVHSQPAVDFNTAGPPNACSGAPTLFQNQTSNPDGRGITAWLWEFGDPADPNADSDREPEHVFEEPGTYSVILRATTASGCACTEQKNTIINESPSTAFTNSAACDDVPVLFAAPPDANITHAYWEIGTSYYEEPSPTHTFRAPGDYRLYLEVTGANDCIATVTKTIHVPAPLNPDFNVWKNCVNDEATFADITTGIDPVIATEWSVNGNETFHGPSFTYTFAQMGNQNVTLKVTTESGCTYEMGKQVPVYVELITLAENPDGSNKLIVTIHNKGNTILQDVSLDVDFSGNLTLRKMLDEPVLPGSKYNMVFNAGIVGMETLRYLCVNLNVENDLSPAGNRVCRKFENQVLIFPSYPNPTASTLNLEWISDAVTTVGISLTDAVGRMVFQGEKVGAIGLNHQTMDLSGLENGLYYLLIDDGATRSRQRIVVAH